MHYIKPVAGVAVLFAILFVAWNMVPPYFHNYQLSDFVDSEARNSTYSTLSADAIRNAVIKEAESDNITLAPEQVSVIRDSNNVAISVNYSVHVDLPFFPQDLNFALQSKNRGM